MHSNQICHNYVPVQFVLHLLSARSGTRYLVPEQNTQKQIQKHYQLEGHSNIYWYLIHVLVHNVIGPQY